MRSRSHPLTYLVMSLILGAGLLINASCGLHFSSGKSKHAKGKNLSSLYQDDGAMVVDDEYAQTDYQNGLRPAYLESDPSGRGLTDNGALMGDDPFAGEWPPTGTAKEYWAQRDRAELLTNQAGLRDVLFDFDSWQLTDEAKKILNSNAQWLKAHPKARVTIEGHCDERGTRAYNYVLGEKRAKRTRNYLASLGVSPEQLVTMSYGKDNPYCRKSSRGCFQQNRRAHLVLGTAVAASMNKEDITGNRRYSR